MNIQKHKLYRIITALTVLLLLASVGLSIGDDTEKAVRMGYLQNDIHHLALWIALDKDMFHQEGTNVEVAGVFRAGPEIMTAFAAGALDMAYVGEAPATTAVANKAAHVVVISQVNTEGSALVIASGRTDITRLGDLEGKTIAIPGHSTVQDFLLKWALREEGVQLEKVSFIVIKPPEMINALRRGDVDAFIAWEPYPAKAQSLEVGKNLATSRELWEGHPCCVLVVDAGFLSKHPEKVNAVLRAHIHATDFINNNQDKAAEIGVKNTGMDRASIDRAMQTVNYTYDLSIDGEKKYVQYLSELGYIKIDNTDSFIKRFINQDLLQSVLAK